MAQLLLKAGTGMTVAGGIQQGRDAETEAKNAQATANYNAQIQEQEAKAIEAKTAFEQSRQAEEGARIESSLLANIGASGAVPSIGTPLLIQAKQASELELENLMIGYEGQIGAARARSQAALDRLQGRIYRQRGRNIARGRYMGAGATLLKGFGSMDWGGGGGTTGYTGGDTGYTRNFSASDW